MAHTREAQKPLGKLKEVLDKGGIPTDRLEENPYFGVAFFKGNSDTKAEIFAYSEGDERKKLPNGRTALVTTTLRAFLLVSVEPVNGRYCVAINPSRPSTDSESRWEGTAWMSEKYLDILPSPYFELGALEQVLAKGLHRTMAIHSAFWSKNINGKIIVLKAPTYWHLKNSAFKEPVYPGKSSSENLTGHIECRQPLFRKRQHLERGGIRVCLALPVAPPESTKLPEATPMYTCGPRRWVFTGNSHLTPVSFLIPASSKYRVFRKTYLYGDSQKNLIWAFVTCDEWYDSNELRTGKSTLHKGTRSGYTLLADLSEAQVLEFQKLGFPLPYTRKKGRSRSRSATPRSVAPPSICVDLPSVPAGKLEELEELLSRRKSDVHLHSSDCVGVALFLGRVESPPRPTDRDNKPLHLKNFWVYDNAVLLVTGPPVKERYPVRVHPQWNHLAQWKGEEVVWLEACHLRVLPTPYFETDAVKRVLNEAPEFLSHASIHSIYFNKADKVVVHPAPTISSDCHVGAKQVTYPPNPREKNSGSGDILWMEPAEGLDRAQHLKGDGVRLSHALPVMRSKDEVTACDELPSQTGFRPTNVYSGNSQLSLIIGKIEANGNQNARVYNNILTGGMYKKQRWALTTLLDGNGKQYGYTLLGKEVPPSKTQEETDSNALFYSAIN